MPVWLRVYSGLCALFMLAIAAAIWLGGAGRIPPLAEVPYLEPVLAYSGAQAALLLIGSGRSARWPEFDLPGRFLHFVLVPAFLFAMALVDAVLFLKASTGPVWATAFLFPGLAGGILSCWLFNLEPQDADGSDTMPAGSIRDDIRKAVAGTGRTSAEAFSSAFQSGFFIGLFFVVLSSSFSVFTVIYEVLDHSIFRQEFDGWGSVLNMTLQRTATPLLIGAGIGASVWLIYILHGLSEFEDRRQLERKHANLNRELSTDELSLIEKIVESAETSLLAQIRPKWLTAANWCFALGFVALLFGYLFFLDDPVRGIGAAWFEEMRTRGEAWHVYLDREGAADLFASLAFFFTYLWVYLSIAHRMKAAGGGYFAPSNERQLAALRETIALEVRKGRLRTAADFDPLSRFREEEAVNREGARAFAVICALATGIFFYLDRMDYTLFTERGITYTDYWRPGVHHSNYEDVIGVSLTCYPDRDDSAQLTYAVHLRGGRVIGNLNADNPNELKSLARHYLDGWERLDARLRSATVPVRPAPAHRRGKRGQRYIPGFCQRELARVLKDKGDAGRIWALMQPGDPG